MLTMSLLPDMGSLRCITMNAAGAQESSLGVPGTGVRVRRTLGVLPGLGVRVGRLGLGVRVGPDGCADAGVGVRFSLGIGIRVGLATAFTSVGVGQRRPIHGSVGRGPLVAREP